MHLFKENLRGVEAVIVAKGWPTITVLVDAIKVHVLAPNTFGNIVHVTGYTAPSAMATLASP